MHEFKSEDLMRNYRNKEAFAFVISTSGKSLLYKIMRSDSPTLHFVHVAVKRGWVYVGLLTYGNFQTSKATSFRFYEPEVAVFAQVWDKVMADMPLPSWATIHSPVRCSECGRWLYDIQSVKAGIGKECAKNALERENKQLKDELEALYEGLR